jgi:large subunit ribosomal protein L30
MTQLKVTYVKSSIGYAKDQKATVRSLGLRKLHQSVVHADSPAIRGMIFKVQHLVNVEEINDGSAASAQASGAGGARTYETSRS